MCRTLCSKGPLTGNPYSVTAAFKYDEHHLVTEAHKYVKGLALARKCGGSSSHKTVACELTNVLNDFRKRSSQLEHFMVTQTGRPALSPEQKR
jgi:hypothetical protein